MGNTSVIFWFSGTGNSLYAAKKLSSELGGMPLVQITDEPPAEAVGGEGAKVGFVFSVVLSEPAPRSPCVR